VVLGSSVEILSWANLPPESPDLSLSPASAPCQLRVCGELGGVGEVAGEKATLHCCGAWFGRKHEPIGERSRAGAAGGMPVRWDAPPETPELENILA